LSHTDATDSVIASGFSVRATVVLLSTIYNYTLSFVTEEQAQGQSYRFGELTLREACILRNRREVTGRSQQKYTTHNEAVECSESDEKAHYMRMWRRSAKQAAC
jgi:hypothetical protein